VIRMLSNLSEKTKSTIDTYNQFYDAKDDGKNERKSKYTTLVNQYYDLATDFYEYGWGNSFHFAPRYKGETLPGSIARHEQYLALQLGLKPGMKVIDVGCGIGGPMMEIARFSGANVEGINNNDYQIKRGRDRVEKGGLEKQCTFIKGDFMHIPQPDNTYDACYAIDATCHAPDKVGIYSEIMRVLKPGAYAAVYEWCMTDKYDPNNKVHQEIKHNVEIGDGLPSLDTTRDVVEALKKCGWEIVEYEDKAPVSALNPIPWYAPLEASFSLTGFRLTSVGVWCTKVLMGWFEKFSLVPKGTSHTHDMLMLARDGMVRGGSTEIFTPMFYFLVRKPLNK